MTDCSVDYYIFLLGYNLNTHVSWFLTVLYMSPSILGMPVTADIFPEIHGFFNSMEFLICEV